jgi:hypothetical protein
MYQHQPQQILIALSLDAMCFSSVDHPQALKYMTLRTQVKMHGDILKKFL